MTWNFCSKQWLPNSGEGAAKGTGVEQIYFLGQTTNFVTNELCSEKSVLSAFSSQVGPANVSDWTASAPGYLVKRGRDECIYHWKDRLVQQQQLSLLFLPFINKSQWGMWPHRISIGKGDNTQNF